MKSKTSKQLLGSVISLMLCCTMLIGTTFAWFTDTATTAVNTIQSGTLDVDLVDENDASLVGETLNFLSNGVEKADILWEPGCTYNLENVYIKNDGNLALKYKVQVSGIEGDAKLLEAIDWTITLDGNEIDIDTFEGKLAPEEKSGVLTLTGHMDENAGNEYQGLSILGIGITVSATQDTVEADSFGTQYDANAEYDEANPVAKTEALTSTSVIKNPEGTVVLDKDLEIDTTELGKIKLDSAYQFEPTMTAAEVVNSEYKTWHADFVVSVDKAIPANSIALVGYYDAWCSFNNDNWVALVNDGLAVEADYEIRLIEYLLGDSNSVSLKDLSDYGNDGIGFLCGVKELDDLIPAGTVFTVELRLYEATDATLGSETGEYLSIGKYTYNF